MQLDPATTLPEDHAAALLIGRVWSPAAGGPVLVRVTAEAVTDLSPLAPTMTELLEQEGVAERVAGFSGARLGSFEAILANTAFEARDAGKSWFLAPCDLQALKACGVTFVSSMLERVIEERAKGDPAQALKIREAIGQGLGLNLRDVRPGSAEAEALKALLLREGLWSQYLEVGIGPDAEVFTKAQPMSAVGTGAEIGLHPHSAWNNPEPEIVLAVNSRGEALGATLGNDVNLRDFEGRSALLLSKAKDNNASCAIGPFIRLFDAGYTIDDVRTCHVRLTVAGADGFRLDGSSNMGEISRDPLDLVAQTVSPTHQYPDGAMLFLGTMFAPTQDRGTPGSGFTHKLGDEVTIASAKLGSLGNSVNHSDKLPAWTFGAAALMRNLSGRGLV
jgi:fumarylacetoacetate (FAA) hydrolase family protein